MLEVRNLTKLYTRRPAVDDVSFTIRPGEILGYLGPNGSGKSTTVKMLTGLLEPSRGLIQYKGCNIRQDLIGYKKVLGYVPEEPNLYPYLTGREYLQLVGRLRCLPAQALESRIDQFLNLLSLHEHRYSPISSYSKGMKQKILISSALLHNPDVLVFDEPLSGLDVTTSLVFKSLIKALAREGKVILYSSHVLEVVEKVCSSVIILRKGTVVANDSVEHLRDLMELPSLEDIFSQLVLQEDTDQIAEDIVEVMQA
ncbi:MAG: ABC transporter ATP-binding protein [Bryobacteraceae bacterium]|jgi:ABC-2 type transport system ATP-binding protein